MSTRDSDKVGSLRQWTLDCVDNPRVGRPRLWQVAVLVGAMSAPGAFATDGEPPAVQRGPSHVEVAQPLVFEGDLRALPTVPPWRPGDPTREVRQRFYPRPGSFPKQPVNPPFFERDPLLEFQDGAPPALLPTFATPALNFDGQAYSGAQPPDPVGDVGAAYYIQMINGFDGSIFTVFDKADGSVVAGPTALESLGSGACASGRGDPIVLYDQLAGRWLLSELPVSSGRLCVYVSQTGDPISGGWYAYQFTTPGQVDYPKYAVWPDAYYLSSNETNPAAYALERAQMLIGGPATSQRFTAPDLGGFDFEALIPSDLEGPTAPPGGSPNVFIRHRDDEMHDPGANNPAEDFLEIFEFHVDFANAANSTFVGPTAISVSEFDSELCDAASPATPFDCFEQPSSSVRLDALREIVMRRSVYRNFGSFQTLTGSFVTDVDGTDHGGVRWYELRDSGGGWALFQEGTVAPDYDHRWMSTVAVDRDGDIALGYNVTGASTAPGLRYTGRRAADPLGTMPQGENVLVHGSSANAAARYGDYASLNVDPVNDCTFWFTGEYNAATTWSTRIGSFVLCDDPPVVAIQTPPTGSSYNQNTTISFTATASDLPEGDLGAAIEWASDLDGALGTGSSLLSALSIGSHTITAFVEDGSMQSGMDQVSVEVSASGCSDYVVLANGSTSGAELHKARFTMTAGPSYAVAALAHLTMRVGTAAVFANGFSVAATGLLTVEIAADPCA